MRTPNLFSRCSGCARSGDNASYLFVSRIDENAESALDRHDLALARPTIERWLRDAAKGGRLFDREPALRQLEPRRRQARAEFSQALAEIEYLRLELADPVRLRGGLTKRDHHQSAQGSRATRLLERLRRPSMNAPGGCRGVRSRISLAISPSRAKSMSNWPCFVGPGTMQRSPQPT